MGFFVYGVWLVDERPKSVFLQFFTIWLVCVDQKSLSFFDQNPFFVKNARIREWSSENAAMIKLK